MVSTVNSTVTVTVTIQCYYLTAPWLGLASTEITGGVLPPGAQLSTCPLYLKQVAVLAGTMTQPPAMLCSLLALARPEVTCVWHRCWAMWWLLMERPASVSFLISWVQYRLISSKEPIYKQQLRIFKFPFVQFKIKHVYTSLSTVL